MKIKKIIAALVLCVTVVTPVTIGNYTASYGEIQLSGKNAEVNVLSTGQGFVVKKRNLKEGKDYIIILNNKGTEDLSDDKIYKIIPVQ